MCVLVDNEQGKFNLFGCIYSPPMECLALMLSFPFGQPGQSEERRVFSAAGETAKCVFEMCYNGRTSSLDQTGSSTFAECVRTPDVLSPPEREGETGRDREVTGC